MRGAGIRSRYYDRFAKFLAEMGIPTLVYDYRGIGLSRPRSLRGFQASVEEWGSKDCAAALQWLATQYPESKRIVVGHSIGGFVTGFVTNGALIDRMLMVSAHTGYWRDYSGRARPMMFLLWHAIDAGDYSGCWLFSWATTAPAGRLAEGGGTRMGRASET